MKQVHIVEADVFPGLVPAALPAAARALREKRQEDVVVTRVLHADGRTMLWLETEHARGWLVAQREEETAAFAQAVAQGLQQGFVPADAAVLACWRPGEALPLLSWGEELPLAVRSAAAPPAGGGEPRLDLYAIVDSAARLRQVLDAGVRTVQIRIKEPGPDLREQLQQCVADCAAAGARLFVNDHWRLAHALGARGIHLGQSDLLELGAQGRAEVLATGMELGVSSHALWELCRARILSPAYIACGPVWPTTTKDMPWLPQGLGNLAWWASVAGRPVTAIGGILEPDQVEAAASAGADGVCIVRGLGADPRVTVPVLRQALERGRGHPRPAPPLPRPTL